MKINEFITKYLGKKVDFDKVWGAQCVDLFRQYCKDVLGIPHTGGVDGAKDLFLLYEKMPLEMKYFDRLERGPVTGDVVIWGATERNKFGHVAIVIGNMHGRDLLVFEQDGLKQDGAKLSVRTIDNLLGYLRPKNV